jgi:hypothetical protein
MSSDDRGLINPQENEENEGRFVFPHVSTERGLWLPEDASRSRRGLIGALAAAGAAMALGDDRVSASSGDRKSKNHRDSTAKADMSDNRQDVSTSKKPSTAGYTDYSIFRIDNWSTIGTLRLDFTSRTTNGVTNVDTWTIGLYDRNADLLNPGVNLAVRPSNGMVWNGLKTYINRGAAGTWARFTYTVSFRVGSQYEFRYEPFIEDVRSTSATKGKYISQNSAGYFYWY